MQIVSTANDVRLHSHMHFQYIWPQTRFVLRKIITLNDNMFCFGTTVLVEKNRIRHTPKLQTGQCKSLN